MCPSIQLTQILRAKEQAAEESKNNYILQLENTNLKRRLHYNSEMPQVFQVQALLLPSPIFLSPHLTPPPSLPLLSLSPSPLLLSLFFHSLPLLYPLPLLLFVFSTPSLPLLLSLFSTPSLSLLFSLFSTPSLPLLLSLFHSLPLPSLLTPFPPLPLLSLSPPLSSESPRNECQTYGEVQQSHITVC